MQLRRRVAAVVVLLAASAMPGWAQTRAAATATITIGEVLSLRALPGSPTAVGAARGRVPGPRERPGAIVLRISANRGWVLTAGPTDRSGEPVPPGGTPFWWRVGGASGPGVVPLTTDYRPASRGEVEAARGGAGREMLITIDLLWAGHQAIPADPTRLLTYRLLPN